MTIRSWVSIRAAAAGAALLTGGSRAPAADDVEGVAFFEKHVRPLLAAHCYECHSSREGRSKGGLVLDTRAGWQAGGDSGDVISPGEPDESPLIRRLRSADPDEQMPPKERLGDDEIARLESWVRMGAPDPRDGVAAPADAGGIDIDAGRGFWAFRPLDEGSAPPVKDAAWPAGDIDRHLLAAMEARGVEPAPEADRRTLIRRATYDLTGLPPTVEETRAFVADPEPTAAAFASVVDRLLASPRFGERWGRHWLDVVRYADSVGRTRNVPFPFAWRYRDWVIDSFNEDKPFDRFVAEQLAGDLLPASSDAERDGQTVATGFLALGSMDLNERDQRQFRADQIDDQIDVTSRAFLGLTVACARCHDHKFDPVSQADYYALAGIFLSTDTLTGQKSRQGGGKEYFSPERLLALASVKAAPATAGAGAGDRGRSPLEKRRAEIDRRLRELQGRKGRADEIAKLRQERKRVQRQLADGGEGGEGAGIAVLGKPLAMGVRDAAKPQDAALLIRGEVDERGETVARGLPAVLVPHGSAPFSTDGSGRLELARWMTAPDNPLPARVFANRVWHHLFGRGIVPTVDNFGETGERPSHPALLDHLAASFAAEGWSVKRLIRSIMLSRAYHASSAPTPAAAAEDEANELFWRMNPRRLEVEAIRDALLFLAGELEEEPPRRSPLDSFGGAAELRGRAGPSVDVSMPVRSVYLPVFRSRLPGLFETFDFAEPSQVIGRRDVTTVAPQALFMLNDEFVVAMAGKASDRLFAVEGLDERERVRHAYAHVLGRPATGEEVAAALELVAADGDRSGVDPWAVLVQALFATAEFRYVL